MSDLLAAQLATPQSGLSPAPVTIASAASVVPTTLVTFTTGTTQITNITPFVTGSHVLIFISTNAAPGGFATGGATPGALANSITQTQNVPVYLVYDPTTQKYWGGTLKLS